VNAHTFGRTTLSPDGPDPLLSGGGGRGPASMPPASVPPAAVRRPASVTLRSGGTDGSDTAGSLDPATRSLADALRVTYRILQGAMVALVGLFAFSGFQSLQEGEEGIRLAFGKVDADRLSPGFQFTLPAPMGELVRVSTSPQSVQFTSEFWPRLRSEDANKTVNELKVLAKGSLDPATDGSVLTADGNIGHVRFSMTYRRRPAESYAQNIAPEREAQIVRAAAMRGVVHAAASRTIDELIKDADVLGQRARETAQRTLDSMGGGIEITELSFVQRIAPLDTIAEFERVQSVESDAQKLVDAAQQARQSTLSGAAGQAAPVLLGRIAALEKAIESQRADDAAAVLAQIDAIIEGKPVEVDGVEIGAVAGGKVAGVMAAARQYRSSVVSRAIADGALFRAKKAAFEANPAVVATSDWTDAFAAFLGRENVEMMLLPAGTRMVDIYLNSDPDVRRQREREATRVAAEKSAADQARQLEENKFKDQGIPTRVRGD
jgi:regulator of protease activity HflC (stomatin/prohibitin superfamily)